jgi:drug/metabolite transporter (DMT)-like permease
MTRVVSRYDDGETSLLYMAAVGAVAMTCIGPWFWVPPTPLAWAGLAAIAVTGTAGHLLLIKALENAPASVLQPFNYTLLVWATLVGLVVFGDFPDVWTIAGAMIVVASGLYTIYRERVRKEDAVPAP